METACIKFQPSSVIGQKLTIDLAILAIFLFITSFISVAFASGNTESFNLQQVADGIYLHQGVHVEFTHPQHDDIANIGFIVGEKCIAIIDTGGSVTIGHELLLSLREISQLPVCYVINTHVHFDHILGNLAFLKEGPQFVGHSQLADAVEQNRDFFLKKFAADLGLTPDRESIISPCLTVDKTMDLDLGNRVIRLTAYQTAHSHNDLTILDLETKTLWTGDLVFRERVPSLDGKLKGWLAVLETLKNQEINLAIPGHGTISHDWPQTYAAEKSYLTMLLNDTREAIKNGQFLEDAVSSIGKEEKQEWLLHEQHHSRNVTKAFTELEWE
ncbi:MAG: quinoprotein relay system zinc metallohydrolase 2 [Proteobacteria bacterium]|nr:quinoprotein relay system zinc metallohydrolase 2 [Pseudomonadota bacterium]